MSSINENLSAEVNMVKHLFFRHTDNPNCNYLFSYDFVAGKWDFRRKNNFSVALSKRRNFLSSARFANIGNRYEFGRSNVGVGRY